MNEAEAILRAAGELLKRQTPVLDSLELEAFVAGFLERRGEFLRAREVHGSPLYLIEPDVLRRKARQFVSAFEAELPELRVYFALKSNNHPAVARVLVEAGLGLDVSSGLELRLALGSEARDIVFSGPGKTDAELRLAVENRDRVTVLMDSFGELERLERIAGQSGAAVRAGVRLTADERGLWRKFGIALADLPGFVAAAGRCRHVALHGVQFHTSWNLDPSAQVCFVARLGAALRELGRHRCSWIEFVDVGGGFWPPQGEWLQPAATPEGRVRQAVPSAFELPACHHKLASAPIQEFARQIGQAVRAELFPTVRCRICAEPGRWLCHDAMHLLMTVVDRKADDMVITDAGTNAVGWERFESDYFPVINLSRPALVERTCYVLGSLCTPHDVWGYACHGEDVRPGDVLLIPTQGAYTYSLRQEFIKPLPKAVLLTPQGPLEAC